MVPDVGEDVEMIATRYMKRWKKRPMYGII